MKRGDFVIQHPSSEYYLGTVTNPILVGGRLREEYGTGWDITWSNGKDNTCYTDLISYEPRKQSEVQ